MKVCLELTERVGDEWRHVLFAEVNTDEGHVAELQNWMQFSCKEEFCWDYPAHEPMKKSET